jgi:RNA polymerase sigma-70 factor (ECF subfamily)
LRRLGVPARDREDVANEVFFRVHQRFDRYDPTRSIRPWLFAFAVRAAAEYRRLARHRVELHDDLEAVAPGQDPDEYARDRDNQRLVVAVLEKLDDDKRAVFVMHDLDEFSIPEIASALGIPLGTAYTRLRAARQQFSATIRQMRARGSER